MKLRTHHLVCLVLLLSALRGAEGSVLPAGEYGFDGRFGVVLSQDGAGIWTEVAHAHQPGNSSSPFLTRQSRTRAATLPAAASTAWTMRPPAAHCAALVAVTGTPSL